MSARRTRSHALDAMPPDGTSLRCGVGLHDACADCECRCHDPQPTLLEVDRG